MIICIGDSHCGAFLEREGLPAFYPKEKDYRNKEFYCYRIITTAYNSINGLETTFKILKNHTKSDLIILTYGEVDCRYYIPKLYSDNINYGINLCVQRYVEYIKIINQEYSNLVILLPIHSSKNVDNKLCYGTYKEREYIIEKFKDQIKNEFCNSEINIFDINKILNHQDDNYEIYFLEDGIHLNQKSIPFLKYKINLIGKEYF